MPGPTWPSYPAQAGRLGRAVRLVVAGGDNATDEEIVAAIVLLSDAARRAARAPAVNATATAAPVLGTGSPRRRPGIIQPSLPGFGP